MKVIMRFVLLSLLIFSCYQLGRINQSTEHYKKIVKCVQIMDHDMAAFYGHGLEGYTFNHAHAYNSHVYMQCIYEDLFNR